MIPDSSYHNDVTTFRDVNLLKLKQIAPVWAQRFRQSSVKKISFYPAVGSMDLGVRYVKKYILLFEVDPQCKPYSDYIHEICNSFSQHQDGIGTRAELLEVDLRKRPEKDKPFGFIREWRILVMWKGMCFEKNYDNAMTFERKFDYSEHGIVTRDEYELRHLLVKKSEVELFKEDPLQSIFRENRKKIQIGEIDSKVFEFKFEKVSTDDVKQGCQPKTSSMPLPAIQDKIYSNLNLPLLKIRAKNWAKIHSCIRRIALYQAGPEHDGTSIKYILAANVPMIPRKKFPKDESKR